MAAEKSGLYQETEMSDCLHVPVFSVDRLLDQRQRVSRRQLMALVMP